MKLQQKLFWLLLLLLPFQLGKHFWPNWSYVLGLRVDYFSPVVYLTDILVFVLLLLWFIEEIKKAFSVKKNKKQNKQSLFLLGTVFLFLIINVLSALNPGAGFLKLFKITELFFLGWYISKHDYQLSFTYFPLAFAVIYSSLISIIQFLNQSSLGGFFWWLGERTFSLSTPGIAKAIFNGHLLLRPYGTFSHPNALAGFILVILIMFIGWQPKNIMAKYIKISSYLLGGITLLLSFSRSVWVLGILIIFYLIFKKIYKKRVQLFLIGFLFLSISVSLFFLLPRFSTNEAFFQRSQLIKSAFLMISSYPLAGVGLNNFIVRLPDYWSLVGFTYWLQPVHNLYLLITAETGFTGIVIFIWFLILTYRKLFNHLFPFSLALTLGLGAILFLSLNDHYWLTLQQNQLLLAVVFGLSWSKIN
jgi:O-antigen ligase